ncbi:cadherin-like domain-containing protein, partial [Klebsiella pneumoniae]|nr:cadherin-like domain-containing protein [Klebsiella pneumoniae]
SPDQFSVNEDTEFRGSLLGNDSHPDARRFSLDPQAVRSPENGVVVLNTDGSFIYTPAANFSGSDSFIYQITDTQGLTAQALVSLTVLATND